jgi:hypothetical protein
VSHTRLFFGLPVVAAYAVLTAVYHLEFSLWLVNPIESGRFAGLRPADHAWPLWWATGAGLAMYLAWRAGRDGDPGARWVTLGFWALWVACVVLFDRYLTFSTNEYVHYPQYALLALLTVWVVDPRRERWPFGIVLLFATVVGIADEVNQYLHETVSFSDYVDFNDFVSNLLGAAAGLLLYYGFRPVPPAAGVLTRAGWIGFAVTGAALLAVLLSIVHSSDADPFSSPMVIDGASPETTAVGDTFPMIERKPRYGRWTEGPRRGVYFVLDPWTGTLLLTGLGLVFASYPAVRASREHMAAQLRGAQ